MALGFELSGRICKVIINAAQQAKLFMMHIRAYP
jgi:hypothetical protein